MRIGHRRSPIALPLVVVLLVAALWCAAPARAQEAPPAPEQATEPTLSPAEQIEARRATLAAERELIDKALAASDENGPSEGLAAMADLAQSIDLLLDQQLSELGRGEEIERTKQETREELETLRLSGPAEPRPYSFLLFERIRDELDAEIAREETRAATLRTAEKNLEQARDLLENRQRASRRAKELLDGNEDDARAAELAGNLRLAELQTRVAEEQWNLRKIEQENARAAQESHSLRRTLLEEKAPLIAREAQLTESDLATKLTEIENATDELERKLAAAKKDLAHYENLWFKAREREAQATSADPVLAEEVTARRLGQRTSQEEIALITDQLERLSRIEQLWNRRFRLGRQTATRTELSSWIAEGDEALTQLERDENVQRARMENLQSDLDALQGVIASTDSTERKLQRWREEQRKQIDRLLAGHRADLASMARQRRLQEKLLTDLRESLGITSFRDRFDQFGDAAAQLWRFELTQIDERPITVRKITLSVLLFLLGLVVARVIATIFGRWILRGLGVNQGAAMALQAIIFYFLILIFTLFALNSLNVPLTVFTLLGGAIAIGVGFGAQNLINNFISRWILLAERPVRIGDIVEVEGSLGNVTAVGARCTQIRRLDGIDVLVPNSVMIEKTLTNWTLSDRDMRTSVKVGVNYGSPVDFVTRLIMTIVEEHGDILADPEPTVLFEDFGDNALIFEVLFWVTTKEQLELRRIRSDVRYSIESAFRAAKIGIAFPQRDVHLDARGPLEVRILEPVVEDAEERARTEKIADREHRLTVLRRVDLFQLLDAEEVASLASALEERHFPVGEDVVRQGDEGSSLFIVDEGLLQVKALMNEQEAKVGHLEPGEFFGERSLLTGESRSATVTALTACKVFELGTDPIAPILARRPELAAGLSEILVRRRETAEHRWLGEHSAASGGRGHAAELLKKIQQFFGGGRAG